MNKYVKYIPSRLVYDMLRQKELENNMCKFNLDKRLTHKPFTIFDVEECQKYIGKEGLFSDSPYDFEDIKNCGKGTLTHFESIGFPFGTNSCDYRYFYPKEELDLETEYKQFTLDSFLKFKEEYNSEWFLIRDKSNKIECDLRYNGYRDTENADKNSSIPDGIFLGCKCNTFEELFERFELFYDGEWVPFGEKV